MQKQLVVLSSYDPGYLRIFEYVVFQGQQKGIHSTVLDVCEMSVNPPGKYHSKILHFFNYNAPEDFLEERLLSYQADLIKPSNSIENSPIPVAFAEALEISIQSALITFFRTDFPNRNIKRIAKTATLLKSQAISVYWEILRLANQAEFETIYILNGRFPDQTAVEFAAKTLGVQVVHLEKGETPDGAYFQQYSPQARIDSQSSVPVVLAGLSKKEISTISSSWISKRSPVPESRNEFVTNWGNVLPDSLEAAIVDEKIICFFTSSQDEFMFLGPEWHLHDWESQFQAFDTLMSHFEGQGYRCILRIHPNLASKEHGCFTREKDSFLKLQQEHPHLIVIWHDQPVNTYLLLDKVEGVVVWDSTVGLEASARGIPVWTCATARYGLIADIKEIHSQEDVRLLNPSVWEVDKFKAEKYIAYLVLRDNQIPQNISSWAPSGSGSRLIYKLAAALVSGGNVTFRDALISNFDVWRHRNISFNFQNLKNKLINK